MRYNSRVEIGGIPIPKNPEEMLRIFPMLVSRIMQLESRLSALENKIKSLETIGGNENQV